MRIPMRTQAFGFTVTEMMVVATLISALFLAFLPSLRSISQSFSRQSAVSNLLNMFEYARVAAIERNRDAHVIFANAHSAFGNDGQPGKDARYRAYRIMIQTENNTIAPLLPWNHFPRGLSFRSEIPSLVGPIEQNANRFSTDYFGAPVTDLPGVTFAANGSIKAPTPPHLLKLFVYEGHYQNGRDMLLKKAGFGLALADAFTLGRLTGRVRWETLSLPSPLP
jgi:type II secretory pathway pseudopilin PulG